MTTQITLPREVVEHLVNQLASRCGTNADEWPLINKIRAALTEQAQPAQRGAPMFTFRECEDSHAIADAVSTERERRAVLSYKAGMDGLAAAIRSGK